MVFKRRDQNSKSHADAQLLIISEGDVGIPEMLGFQTLEVKSYIHYLSRGVCIKKPGKHSTGGPTCLFQPPPRKLAAQRHVSLLATEPIWAVLTAVLELSA